MTTIGARDPADRPNQQPTTSTIPNKQPPTTSTHLNRRRRRRHVWPGDATADGPDDDATDRGRDHDRRQPRVGPLVRDPPQRHGVNWSREAVHELAGVEREDVSMVTRVQATGDGGVVVAVNLRAAEGETPRQLVLVGTPRG